MNEERGGRGGSDSDKGGGRERDKGVEINTPLNFVFRGSVGEKDVEKLESKVNSSSSCRSFPTSYKDKLLSLGCLGYFIKHGEEEDIANGWKAFFAKKNPDEGEGREKEGSDAEDNGRMNGSGKYPALRVSTEQYSA